MYLCRKCLNRFDFDLIQTKHSLKTMCETCFTLKQCYEIDGKFIIPKLKLKVNELQLEDQNVP